jgi:hypothetical protein
MGESSHILIIFVAKFCDQTGGMGGMGGAFFQKG